MERFLKKRGPESPLRTNHVKISRQGKLTDCKKVVKIGEVEELGEIIDEAYRCLTRLGVVDEEENMKEEEISTCLAKLKISLRKLGKIFISLETLEQTKIGKKVNKVAIHATVADMPEEIVNMAQELVQKWKATAKQGSENRKKQELDEKEGRIPVCRRTSFNFSK